MRQIIIINENRITTFSNSRGILNLTDNDCSSNPKRAEEIMKVRRRSFSGIKRLMLGERGEMGGVPFPLSSAFPDANRTSEALPFAFESLPANEISSNRRSMSFAYSLYAFSYKTIHLFTKKIHSLLFLAEKVQAGNEGHSNECCVTVVCNGHSNGNVVLQAEKFFQIFPRKILDKTLKKFTKLR